MIIVFRSRYSLQQIFSLFQWIFALATGAVFFHFCMALKHSAKIQTSSILVKSIKSGEDFENILAGPFALQGNSRSALALSLEQKLVLLGQSTRPDLKTEEKVFCLGIKGTNEQAVVKEGESLFFEMTRHSSGGLQKLEFANHPTSLSLVPQNVENRSLLLQMSHGLEEAQEVLLPLQTTGTKVGESYLFALQEAKWWGPDLFFRQYGGAEYLSYSKKHKLEVIDGGGSYFLFVTAKDFLSFKEGKWQVLSDLKEADRQAPLAQVRSLSSNQLEIEVWDEKGFSRLITQLPLEKASLNRISPDQLLTQPKLRSAHQISCQMGKKRLLLKEGDWLFKGKNGWHKIESYAEIEAYLHHELRGEVFIVDRIDGKGGLQGHYFNEMRTQMQPVSITLSETKKKVPSKR